MHGAGAPGSQGTVDQVHQAQVGTGSGHRCAWWAPGGQGQSILLADWGQARVTDPLPCPLSPGLMVSTVNWGSVQGQVLESQLRWVCVRFLNTQLNLDNTVVPLFF